MSDSGSQSNSPARAHLASWLRRRRWLVTGLVGLALVGLGVRVVLDRDDLVAAVPAAGGAPQPLATGLPTPTTTGPTTPGPTATPSRTAKATPTPSRTTTKPTKVTVPATGPGTYARAHESVAPASSGGVLKRYDVRVEKNLDIDPDRAALLIAEVLNDKRSWRGTGRWRFQLVPAGQPADLHAYLVTPGTTDELCAPLLTRGEVSCQNGNRVVLNAKRWTLGVKYYGDDVTNYRRYLINHEFGHALGHNHVSCPGAGDPAPVMMQQTKGLGGCRKNPWPLAGGD